MWACSRPSFSSEWSSLCHVAEFYSIESRGPLSHGHPVLKWPSSVLTEQGEVATLLCSLSPFPIALIDFYCGVCAVALGLFVCLSACLSVAETVPWFGLQMTSFSTHLMNICPFRVFKVCEDLSAQCPGAVTHRDCHLFCRHFSGNGRCDSEGGVRRPRLLSV